MPFITLTGGITIKVPTRGTTSWSTTILEDNFQKISEHDHTGGGKGLQLGAGAFADDSITDIKILLRNDFPLRSRNNAGTGNINILKVDANDNTVIQNDLTGVDYTIANNTASATQIGSLSVAGTSGGTIEAIIKREGAANLSETQIIKWSQRDGVYNYFVECSGDDSGVEIIVNESTGNIEYTSTDNPSSTLEEINILIHRAGE